MEMSIAFPAIKTFFIPVKTASKFPDPGKDFNHRLHRAHESSRPPAPLWRTPGLCTTLQVNFRVTRYETVQGFIYLSIRGL